MIELAVDKFGDNVFFLAALAAMISFFVLRSALSTFKYSSTVYDEHFKRLKLTRAEKTLEAMKEVDYPVARELVEACVVQEAIKNCTGISMSGPERKAVHKLIKERPITTDLIRRAWIHTRFENGEISVNIGKLDMFSFYFALVMVLLLIFGIVWTLGEITKNISEPGAAWLVIVPLGMAAAIVPIGRSTDPIIAARHLRYRLNQDIECNNPDS